MENNQISMILTYVLITMVVILLIMIFVFLRIVLKERKRKKELFKEEKKSANVNIKEKEKANKIGSVLDFMEFETIEDNMVIKKEKQKYIMIVECQGVNYDLMSGVEKASVEQGFLQFLNTLKHPVQLYIQTRAINLENSIENYKSYVKNIEDTYNRKKFQYEQTKKANNIPEEEEQKMLFEVTKSRNLYEYGKDIIRDTEKMSLNSNILNKKYYIVLSYYYESQSTELIYDKEEIRNMAFSDLYGKSQSVIRTLTSCGVNGRILNSLELVELLYMAYNRDGAETYGIERALKASYDKLYSTAPEVLDKKIRELEKEIEEKAIKRAQEELKRAKTQKEKEVEKKEKEKDKLIEDIAKIILEGNKQYVGKEITQIAIKNIEKTAKEKEGGKVNEKK